LSGWVRRWWPTIVAHVALLALWQVAVVWGEVPAFVMPTPLATIETLFEPHYNWAQHTLVTAAEVFGGYALAVVVGVGLAILFSWFGVVDRFLMPLIVTLNMVPKIAMAPLFIVWLSFGIVPNMVIAFTICFFPILLTTARGLAEVEPELLDLVRALRATRLQIFRKIQLPNALPYVFSGMKIAVVLAVAGAIVGEFIGSAEGLGYLMLSVQGVLDTAGMFMAVILVSLIGIALYGLVILLERLVVVTDARIE